MALKHEKEIKKKKENCLLLHITYNFVDYVNDIYIQNYNYQI